MAVGRKLALSLVVVAYVATTTGQAASADTPGAQNPISVTVLQSNGSRETEATTVAQLVGQGCPTTSENPAQYVAGGQPANGAETPNPASTWTLGTILTQCLSTPIPIGSITGLEIDRSAANKPPEQLSRGDLVAPSPYLDPNDTPIVAFADGTTLNYYRPQISRSDANFDDSIVENPGSSLHVSVFTGPLLNVTITPSTTHATPGQTVTFSASVPADSGTGISYSWSFDGAEPGTATGSEVSAKFPVAFGYTIYVTATDAQGGGGSASIQLPVGSPVRGPKSNGNGKSKTHRNSPSPHSGARHTTGTGSSPRGASSGASGAGSPGQSNHTAAVGGGSGAGAHGHRSTTRSGSSPASGPATHVAPADATRVSGRVIGELIALPVSSSPLGEAAASAGHSAAFSAPGGTLTWLWAVIASLAALTPIALGAGRELRRLRSSP